MRGSSLAVSFEPDQRAAGRRDGRRVKSRRATALTVRLHRYYTCSIRARQRETGYKGHSIPMEKLDDLVAGFIEDRLLQPERLEEVLASVLDRRQERTERRNEHIAELNRRAAEADLRLKRL